ncbi:AraC family transcriptional regulator [Leptothoe sp. LEGE 181152]|nr:AraC family transcriptional regulator [Leptothoe sp. LEGE 181152]
MAIDLSELEILNLMQHSQVTEFYTQYHVPPQLGKGCHHTIQLRGSLGIHIVNGCLPEPLIVRRQHEELFPLTAKFYLSGASKVKAKNVPENLADYEEIAGCNYLYHLPGITETEEWQAHIPTVVVIAWADLDYFRTFSPGDQALPQALQRLLKNGDRFHQPLGKTSLAMNRIVRQILDCPYQGMMQQIYLECKVLELLTLQLSCLEEASSVPKKVALTASELEQVEYARELLVQCLSSPPSLVDLAHRVGLSDRKLKQGFRHLFGTTVFGYLCDYRMEQAQHLLRHSHVTVAHVAARVGYRNPEAFSTAFRRKFAISPKAYQLGQQSSSTTSKLKRVASKKSNCGGSQS